MDRTKNIRQKIRSGFILLVTLFTLLSITLVVTAVMKSAILVSKVTAVQSLELADRQLFIGLELEAQKYIDSKFFLSDLEQLNSLDYFLSNEAAIDFTQLVTCRDNDTLQIWRQISTENSDVFDPKAFSTFALMTEKRDMNEEANTAQNDFYLVIFKHCVQAKNQQFWLKRWQVYKVFSDGVADLRVSRHNSQIELIN